MFGIENYGSFVAAILVFQAAPGPGTLAILNATARNGVGAGLAAVAGTLAGDFVYMVAAVAGLAAVLQTFPAVFQALQWLGAAYLVWIGIGLLRARVDPTADGIEPRRRAGAYFRQALAVSLTNPKVVLFFVAFFPLFLSPGATPSTLVAMMVHVTVLSLAWQAGLVLIGDEVARRLRGFPAARRLANRAAGVALIGFGAKLALANR